MGSLICLAVLILLGLFSYANSLVKKYTVAQANPLPAVETSPEMLKQLQARWGGFFKAIQSRKNPPPFQLTLDDLNRFA